MREVHIFKGPYTPDEVCVIVQGIKVVDWDCENLEKYIQAINQNKAIRVVLKMNDLHQKNMNSTITQDLAVKILPKICCIKTILLENCEFLKYLYIKLNLLKVDEIRITIEGNSKNPYQTTFSISSKNRDLSVIQAKEEVNETEMMIQVGHNQTDSKYFAIGAYPEKFGMRYFPQVKPEAQKNEDDDPNGDIPKVVMREISNDEPLMKSSLPCGLELSVELMDHHSISSIGNTELEIAKKVIKSDLKVPAEISTQILEYTQDQISVALDGYLAFKVGEKMQFIKFSKLKFKFGFEEMYYYPSSGHFIISEMKIYECLIESHASLSDHPVIQRLAKDFYNNEEY